MTSVGEIEKKLTQFNLPFLCFSSFSPTDQKQLDYNFWSDVQILNAADKNRERERRKTQNNYTGSFPKPEVVMSPLHFQGEFTKM